MDEKVGCAWVFFRKEDQVPCLQQTIRLSSDTSVFRSESIALLEASAFASKLQKGSTIIFTDSKSNLEALENASLTNPEIAQLFTILQVNPKITIQRIPGHSGIPEKLNALHQLWLSSTRSSSHEQPFDLFLTTRQRPDCDYSSFLI
jgi:hypothetical protein